MPFSTKFGAPLTLLQSIAKDAAQRKLLLKGISFHVGSGCGNPNQFQHAIHSAFYGLHILSTHGHSVDKQILDIGGGFVGEPFFTPAATIISKILSQIKLSPKCIAEPGRFFAASSHDLFTQVIGKKRSPNGSGWRYTIDESLYGQFSCIPFDQARPMWHRVGSGERKRSPAVIFGRTCDSVDMIASAQFAEELEVGDWLWWPHMGAYTSVTATEFNGFPRPPVVSVDSLPNPKDILDSSWPSSIQYVSPVKTPLQ
jgi:ornithine decarboxylase